MVNDPIADMLTRISNAVGREKPIVDIPGSRLLAGIAATLQREGFIWDSETVQEGAFPVLRLHLKYGPNGERVIHGVKRVSKPGRRVFVRARDYKPVRYGTGISVVSTPRGILSNREAQGQKLGGELLAEIW